MRVLRIHPAIGVARVGNSDLFFDGPEHPGVPANWDPTAKAFKQFKDLDRKILRQAARFRVFEFDESSRPVREITNADGTMIEWRVHVANRKASFFSFNGQSGAGNAQEGPYDDRSTQRFDKVEKALRGPGQPDRRNRRNHKVADRRGLEIDPGEVRRSAPGRSDLIDEASNAPIKNLGHIDVLADGSLRFVPGTGCSASVPDAAPIDEYANNDGWFDDMCDGLIAATVTAPGGQPEPVESAWVVVGPPDFAPGIGNVVSLYDLLSDIAIRHRLEIHGGDDPVLQDLRRQQANWRDDQNDFAPEYEPSFTQHIYPILARALAAKDVHEPPKGRPDYHERLAGWTKLSRKDDDHAQFRTEVFVRLRDPNSDQLDREGMPRGLGDDFITLDDFESEISEDEPKPTAFMSLTKVQFALLKAWSDGRFIEDWPHHAVRFAPVAEPGNSITPHGLDRAALENCVGGPFFPGIEVGWLIRRLEIHAAAFRLQAPGVTVGALTFGPGFFSQQMALPWHADFYDCHREDHTPEGASEKIFYMWWTAQRPDYVRAERDGPYRRWVEPFDEGQEPDDADAVENISRFEKMRTRWNELSFVVFDGTQHVEQK